MGAALIRPWQRRPVPPAEAVAAHASRLGCEVLGRLYASRGAHVQDLDPDLALLHPPDRLDGAEAAAALLADAVARGDRMVVVGDYDADGATATAVAVRGLRACGAQVGYVVPDREREGYGLTPEVTVRALAQAPQLIITVDHGIASHAGIALAARAGVPVLVTDHHLPGPELPPAACIVNPNLPGASFPSRHLAGVGVMFYVLLALRAELRARGAFARRAEPPLTLLLDLVALGTVADMVTLDANNRRLVAAGLRRIAAGRAHPGVLALLDRAPGACAPITAADLAFRAGPRLNAAGRLDDMALGIECLLTDDPAQAVVLAARLTALNAERRELEGRMREEAFAALAGLDLDPGARPVLCVHRPDWHAGVVGLIAGRLRERYARPAAAFAPAGDGWLRGSVRSIPGVHVRDALADVAAQHPGLVARFGGHAMAAGLSLAADALKVFESAFADAVSRQLGGVAPDEVLWTDGALQAGTLTLELARRLQAAGPWGSGFPEPLFDGAFELKEARVVGGSHLRLRLADPAGQVHQAIAFGAGELHGALARRVEIAYRVQVNEWNGRESAQLCVEAFSPTALAR